MTVLVVMYVRAQDRCAKMNLLVPTLPHLPEQDERWVVDSVALSCDSVCAE